MGIPISVIILLPEIPSEKTLSGTTRAFFRSWSTARRSISRQIRWLSPEIPSQNPTSLSRYSVLRRSTLGCINCMLMERGPLYPLFLIF